MDLQLSILMLGVSSLIISIMLYVVVLSRWFKLKKDTDEIEFKRADMLHRAKIESEQIIAEAIHKSRKMILETQDLKQEFSKDIEKNLKFAGDLSIENLKKHSEDLDKYYSNLATHLNEKFAEKQSDVFLTLKDFEANEIRQVDELIQLKKMESKKRIEEFEVQEKENIKKQIEEYKNDEIARIDREVTGIVESVTREVLKKAITVPDHEKLVIEALENAKRDSVLK